MFVTLWLHCPVAIDKSLTQSESPSCAPEVETGYFIQTSAVNVKCSPVEISCGGAWQGCLYTEVVLLCLMQPDTTDFPEPCCPEVADACSEESRVCVLPHLQPGYHGTRPAAGMYQGPDRILSSVGASSGKQCCLTWNNLLQFDQTKVSAKAGAQWASYIGLHRRVSFPSFGPGLSVEGCAIPRQAYGTHLQLFKELYPRLMGIPQTVGFQLPAAKSLQSHHRAGFQRGHTSVTSSALGTNISGLGQSVANPTSPQQTVLVTRRSREPL